MDYLDYILHGRVGTTWFGEIHSIPTRGRPRRKERGKDMNISSWCLVQPSARHNSLDASSQKRIQGRKDAREMTAQHGASASPLLLHPYPSICPHVSRTACEDQIQEEADTCAYGVAGSL